MLCCIMCIDNVPKSSSWRYISYNFSIDVLTLGLALQQEKKFGLLILLRGKYCFYTLLHSRYTQVYMNGQQGSDIRVVKLPQVF